MKRLALTLTALAFLLPSGATAKPLPTPGCPFASPYWTCEREFEARKAERKWHYSGEARDFAFKLTYEDRIYLGGAMIEKRDGCKILRASPGPTTIRIRWCERTGSLEMTYSAKRPASFTFSWATE